MRQLKTLNEEVEWISKRTRGGRAKAEILGWLFAATIYHTWSERNARRFHNERRESGYRLREIVLQLHIRGQSYKNWRKILECLNNFPS